ncbi:MAG: class II aldolase/adducin family protein, partial [Clostridiales bacterium]|nr:class II aldolase/adducin family protein [Clostridiales bacterium]
MDDIAGSGAGARAESSAMAGGGNGAAACAGKNAASGSTVGQAGGSAGGSPIGPASGAKRPAELAELAAMSNLYGRQARYVLAGGGNTSYKNESELYIKASGASLATVRPGDFVGLLRGGLDAIMAGEYERGDEARREAAVLADMMGARLAGSGGKRPSVETLLHNIFPERFVLHLHPALVNGLT